VLIHNKCASKLVCKHSCLKASVSKRLAIKNRGRPGIICQGSVPFSRGPHRRLAGLGSTPFSLGPYRRVPCGSLVCMQGWEAPAASTRFLPEISAAMVWNVLPTLSRCVIGLGTQPKFTSMFARACACSAEVLKNKREAQEWIARWQAKQPKK